MLRQGLLRWKALSRRQQMMLAGGAFVLVLAVSYFGYRSARGCSSREAVEDRVALITAELQQAASEHRITIPELADRIKRVNDAANAYIVSHDPQAYCDVLNTLRAETEE
ncbi:MAG: hypothetical protein ABL973_20480 [Micropepsaceae bacterium]